MKKKFSCLMFFSLVFIANSKLIPEQQPNYVPLGAYLSWERIYANSSYFGKDIWDDFEQRVELLAINNFNTLWITNLISDDFAKVVEICSKYNIKLLPNLVQIEARIEERWIDNGSYYEDVIPKVVEIAGDSNTVVGWVLSDEPPESDYYRLEQLRSWFNAVDPSRFSLFVNMWNQIPYVVERTSFPVIIPDIYPFFGPNDPNGPHTDSASKAFFRRTVNLLYEIGNCDNRLTWVMGMNFNEIWGPRYYDEDWHLIGRPGSYLHWRHPTIAETRWQVWESFRGGNKGYFSYTLAPEAPDDNFKYLSPPDVSWRSVLAKEEVDLGPNALTNPDTSSTPQLEEIGSVFETISKYSETIMDWNPDRKYQISVTSSGSATLFYSESKNQYYTIIVNDDLRVRKDIRIHINQSVRMAIDGKNSSKLNIETEPSKRYSNILLDLEPGDGTIVELYF